MQFMCRLAACLHAWLPAFDLQFKNSKIRKFEFEFGKRSEGKGNLGLSVNRRTGR
eukprot:jgi/Psemu1/313521/fgenesh1_kg.1221_\